MNLRGIVNGAIQTVNPNQALAVQISAGYTTVNHTQTPAYATPGSITASIDDTGTLTVATQTSGTLQIGQTLSGASVAAGTFILAQVSGSPGGVGTYTVSVPQVVATEAMTTSFVLQGNIQRLTAGDLQHLSGINLNTTRNKIYLYGDIEAIVRPDGKGGDIITSLADGKVYLVAQVFETWGKNWCAVAATLQNGA